VKTKYILIPATLGLVLILGAVVPQSAKSIPAFARKEGVACAVCHTTVPHLNEYGFNYRKAGFRDPGDIGKELPEFNFADVFSARVQARYDVKHRDFGNNNTTTTNQLQLHEITLYPASGSFGKHYGSLFEMSFAGEDFVELENAYLRYVWGTEDAFWSARLGLFHPFEGYGGSDRPFSLSRPLFQGATSNNGMGSTFFKMWGFDQAGAELAYVKGRTSASVTLFNGIFVANDEGAFKAFPASGGHLTKKAGFTNDDSKDVQLFLNQIIDENGSGVSLYYYFGQSDLPATNNPAAFSPGSAFENDFHRVAGYGSYAFSPKAEAMGGFAWGQDHFIPNSNLAILNTAEVTGDALDTFNSIGFFGEADFHPTDITTVGGRFDWFDPSSDVDNNEVWAATGFANVPLNDGFQVIVEAKHKQTKVGANADDFKDDSFQVRMIWIQ